MPSTNGHGAKRAILYARVSADEQPKSGYSLAQQLEALGGRQTRTTARRELESLGHRQQHLAELERDKDTVLEYCELMAPDSLYSLTPEQRNHIYKALRLEVVMKPGGGMEICGPFPETPVVSKIEVSS